MYISNYCCSVNILDQKNEGLSSLMDSAQIVYIRFCKKNPYRHEQNYKFYRTAGSLTAIKIYR